MKNKQVPQTELFNDDPAFQRKEKTGPVECLGMSFENDDKRREYFLEKLKEKLKDPEFRKIEGFPIGEDKDILALSDPPYYTACPNPWIGDFLKYFGNPCPILKKINIEKSETLPWWKKKCYKKCYKYPSETTIF
jgi:hypothetical protein